jgi:hypothetical protein
MLLVFFVLYAVVGMVLSLHYNLVDSDGPSRVANAGYVLFSLDPHLAAIGFVWNPLPSLSEIPILLFSNLWPALLTRSQAGTFMAAAYMAGAVWQVRGIALDRKLPNFWRWVVIAAFAFNPMIIMFGGNGMSEAPYIFFTLWAVRRLLRWARTDKINDLVVAGIALGLGYLTRYEVVAEAAAATCLIVGISALRSKAPGWGERFKRGVVDGTIVAFPFAVCFSGWALASWITTGTAFPQFSSQYGNSSQLVSGASFLVDTQKAAGGPIALVIRDVLYLGPLLPVIVIIVLALAVRRIELDSLVPISLFGAVLLFETAGQITGQTFPWFRFFIMAIPLTVVLVMLIWPQAGARAPVLSGNTTRFDVNRLPASGGVTLVGSGLVLMDRVKVGFRGLSHYLSAHRRLRGFAGGCLVVLLLAPSIPLTWSGMLNPVVNTAANERVPLLSIADPGTHPILQTGFDGDWYIATYLDQLNLPNGSVLMDTYLGFAVWLDSNHRKQFVITNDQNFSTVLNSPAQSGIQYILVPDPRGLGAQDAINLRYPTMYRSGAGIASLVMSVPSTGGGATWRIYRVGPIS